MKNKIIDNVEKKYWDKNIFFSSKSDVFYLTKFDSSNLNIFFIKNKWYGITDDRYYENAKEKITWMKILNQRTHNFENFISNKLIKKDLYIDENDLKISQFNYLKNKYKDINFKLINLEKLREIKTKEEIENIKIAAKITDEIFYKVKKNIKPSMTEIDVKKMILFEILNSDAEKESFEIIVAAGKNSAFPHYKSSNYKIKENDVILIDFGVFYNGYCSDMTRTFILGDEDKNEEFKKIYKIVKNALEIGIKKAKAGIEIKEIDKEIRNYISNKGYGKYFLHSSGHGIGIDVHESPNIYQNNKEKLKENMVITIEPGIYLNDKFGIRIEQDILIKKDKNVILNKSKF